MSEQIQPAVSPPEAEDTENWEDGEYDEEDEEDDDDDDDDDDGDIAAEAEEMARRLGEQLEGLSNVLPVEQPVGPPPAPPYALPPSKKQEAAIITIKAILALLDKDPAAHATLGSTIVSGAAVGSVLDALRVSMTSGSVPKELCGPLSQSLVALARSEALFGDLRHSDASSIQLDLGKRKRENHDDGTQVETEASRPPKKPFIPSPDIYATVSEAVHIVSHALNVPTPITLDSALISSIQHPLHHIFLFAVTSSSRGGPEVHALQEIGGLIQVLGVLSGIHIGSMPSTDLEKDPSNAPTDIGTAVYPCLVAGCRKTFSRLFSLRAHHRIHASHRPFRCLHCPASFSRNHDLRRHTKMHERKAWKCGGCDRLFSRRDAIKRHKNTSQSRSVQEACVNAEILEIEVEEGTAADMSREEKRAKLWNGIAMTEAQTIPPSMGYPDGVIEEGEIPPQVIAATQTAVMHLQPILQTYVANASGTPLATATPLDPTGGQATLASVIARAQSQSIPPADTESDGDLVVPPSADSIIADVSPQNQENGSNEHQQPQSAPSTVTPPTPMPKLSMYGLSDEQTKLLEEAITSAALAAQAQAEAEAALEEEDDDEMFDGDDDEESNMDMDEVEIEEVGSRLPATT
ncbi:hypothetical protein D9758_012885 [Tetrapyrgos nigripes]|uniref:C2H2-type domain-containing protein n=1 Tax=Tetrapyrgos nigripes TaxID=182062 RepID=A0A8H5CN85_9AGAR|nr:hypothetical protein D9758_012885 [Tetrapyrgos nigripes]